MTGVRSPAAFPGHRVFAWFWERAVKRESREERAMRRFVAGGATGRVLEIAAGVGTNRTLLPDGVMYIGIEPDPYMRQRAVQHARDAGLDPRLVAARAEALPFPAASFDTVIVTLSLCSVHGPQAALAEMRRVLRPGGELRFMEHVRPRSRVLGRLTDAITPAWKRLGGGCHPNRRTLQTITSAGFDISEQREFSRSGIPMVAGVAVIAGDGGSTP